VLGRRKSDVRRRSDTGTRRRSDTRIKTKADRDRRESLSGRRTSMFYSTLLLTDMTDIQNSFTDALKAGNLQ